MLKKAYLRVFSDFLFEKMSIMCLSPSGLGAIELKFLKNSFSDIEILEVRGGFF
jgi:hypothetical protein